MLWLYKYDKYFCWKYELWKFVGSVNCLLYCMRSFHLEIAHVANFASRISFWSSKNETLNPKNRRQEGSCRMYLKFYIFLQYYPFCQFWPFCQIWPLRQIWLFRQMWHTSQLICWQQHIFRFDTFIKNSWFYDQLHKVVNLIILSTIDKNIKNHPFLFQ